ncbi:1-aminocyclopropane-1-carboxylate deaminase/D-cysteine desulfhydrase [Streptomyces alkaliterrae]|uniref:Pyridoxal-phosphate dependent enzyme n=1 Tax=Streptomyces alkaliterrae TaxID=2213162 RepID=A0A5P0YX78_9ACTN|nr:pyridoxal-phosphate dependent enzyme [Streptomyces alkaliterrae]MBB1258606.1 pyridoxal-phosphate dependent enzyme [Streptomyces alkaliterrae]MQS04888.1 pyridoxal-phosphate dependent enzyme [Streptomyces alkaliterrae]
MTRSAPSAPLPPPDGGGLPRPRLPSPLQEVREPAFERRGLRLLLKRDDLIHPLVGGNKWRKLVPNLRAAAASGAPALLTFGGAYSNHLRATAAAGRLLGLPTIGVVRGEELAERPLNPSLTRCRADGMRLWFTPRADYRRRREEAYLAELRERFGAVYVVPEGGSNAAAVEGCVALGEELRGLVDVAAVACGTGGTLAGMAAGGPTAVGVPVLRGDFLAAEVRRLQEAAFGGPRGRWRLAEGFHFGGYARTTPELTRFADDFEQRHGVGVERVYVAKLLYALTALAEAGDLPPGAAVAAVVTGTPDPLAGD